MTGASHSDLDLLLRDWTNPRRREIALQALQGNKPLMVLVKGEVARLEDTSGPRNLLEHDEVSRRVHAALLALLAAYDRAFPSSH